MALDDLLMQIGELGRYQWFLFFVSTLCTLICPISVFSHIFMVLDVPHWCEVGSWNATHCEPYGLDPFECHELQKNLSIPWSEEAEGYAKCHMYNVSGVEFYPGLDPTTLEVIECQNGWVFDEEPYLRSLTAKLNLVCDREVMIRVSQSAFFIGALIGCPIFGTLSDRFGRVRIWFFCVLFSFVFSTLTLYPVNVWLYTLLRLITAMAACMLYTMPFVYVSEIVGGNKRTLIALLIPFAWSTGYLIITTLSWLIGDWFYIQLCVIGIHIAVFPVFIFELLPKSPRWLIAKGRLKEAGEILTTFARRNGEQMPQNYMDELLDESKMVKAEVSEIKLGPADLYKNRTMAFWMAVLVIMWFGHGMTYIGLTFLSSELGFDFWLSYFIQAFVEVPGFAFALLLLQYIGRRPSTSFFMIASGVGCLVALFFPPGVWKAICVFSSKFAISASYVIMDVYTVEVLPTNVRGFGLHFLAVMAMIGNVIAPLIIILADIWSPFPLVLCSVVVITGGTLLLFLPETRGTMLPDTMEEALSLGKTKQRIPSEDDGTKV